MRFCNTTSFPSLLLPFTVLTLTHAACFQDNCYRALSNRPTPASSFCSSYTTSLSTAVIPTTTTLPFASQCAYSPSRLSSACGCLVTPRPCTPGPVLNQLNNGGFDQVYIPEVGQAVNEMPPWYFENLVNSMGDWIREGPGGPYGEGAAAFHIEGRHPGPPPNPSNGATLARSISICSGTHYTIALYARHTVAWHMNCSITVSTQRAGIIALVPGPLSEEFYGYGPWSYTPVVAPGSVQSVSGSYEDVLRIRFECLPTDAPYNVLAEVDSVEIQVAP